MKMVKGLLLGTAAGLVAMTGAQAADLPVKAKAVEYVKICSLYGAGFYYMPGTDTCIKFGGYLRVDATVHGNIYNGPAWNGSNGNNDRWAHDYQTRSRLAFTVDARTATQYGVVRIFGQTDWQFSTFGASGGIQNSAVLGATSVGTTGGINNDTPGNGYVAVEQAFVQFAGFTFGKSISARAMPWNGYMANNNTSFFIGGPDYVTGVNNIQYTYQWGNGVSTSIGVDEDIVFNRTSLANTAHGVSAVGGQGNVYGGQTVPDLVGNFKIDQAWGIFTVAANTHLVRAAYYGSNSNILASLGAPFPGIVASGGSELTGHPKDKLGGSVSVGLQLKADAIAPGDRFTVDATYAKGNTKAVISTSAASPSFAMFGKGISGVTYESLGFGYTSDGVFFGTSNANGTGIELTTAYGVRAAFVHNWNAQWQSSLFGSYSKVDYNGTASAQLCAQYTTRNAAAGAAVGPVAIATGPGFSCNPDFAIAQVGFRTGWTPVAGLTFSTEVLWAGLDQKFAGTATLSPGGVKPAGSVYNFKDQDTVSVNFRVQRNF